MLNFKKIRLMTKLAVMKKKKVKKTSILVNIIKQIM